MDHVSCVSSTETHPCRALQLALSFISVVVLAVMGLCPILVQTSLCIGLCIGFEHL